MRAEQRWRRSSRFRWNFLLVVATMVTTVVAMTGLASAETQASYQGQVTSNTYSQSAGSGLTPPNTGTPIDPLRYDCATPSSGPSGCQNVGLTHGYYENHVVNFLYSANFWCDHSVASKASTGCEGGKAYNHLPPAATSQDPLYIPVALGFTPSQGLQCPKQGDCIDHPASMDMSALSSVLDPILHTTASQLANAPLTPHSHVIYTRNDNLPEWWNVVAVPVTSQAGFNTVISTTSKAQLMSDLGKGGVYTTTVPTNAFLYFQVLAGTGTSTADAATAQNVYHGAGGPPAAAPGSAWDPLTNDCNAASGSAPPACNADGIGLTKGFYDGHVVNFLYSENYFCDRSVDTKSSDGCEAGASYGKLPPGTTSASETDPLYIITPLYTPAPTNLQCPKYCIDHPMTVDLSRLASVLDPILHTTPSELANAPLPNHSHIVTTTDNNQPEWWNVKVIGVTSPTAYKKIISSPNEYATARQLAASNGGVTAPIATNAFLWFQVLPGEAVPTGAPQTGGGSTAGLQDGSLFALGGGLVLIGLVAFVAVGYRRRYADR